MNESPELYDGNPRIAQKPDYYDLFYEVNGDVPEKQFSAGVCVVRVTFVLLSRVGFILVQVGSIPVENIYVIVLHNLVQIAVVSLSYGLIGSKLSFGPDTHHGWIGSGGWNADFSFGPFLDQVVIGFCGCLLATAQTLSFLVGRISLAGDMILTTFYCAFFQPLLMHWIWMESGWMMYSNFIGYNVFVKDHAGVLTLHIPSAIFGMIGALFLGRRIIKLKDVDKLGFGPGNALTIFLGYFMIIIGYIIFSIPSSLYELIHVLPSNNFSEVIVLNSLLAIGGGILMSTILQFITYRDIYRYTRIIRCVQGGIAALISVGAAVDRYTPLTVLLISISSATIFFFFSEVLQSTALEDVCNFISSHLICGFIGVMLCPLLAQKENFGNPMMVPPRNVNMLWQLICTAVILGFSVLVSLFLFFLLKIIRLLRNQHEVINHKRANILRDSVTKRSFLGRLFPINTTTDYVEPGYREEYLDSSGQNIEAQKNISPTEGDTVRKRDRHNNKFGTTIMTVNTELNTPED